MDQLLIGILIGAMAAGLAVLAAARWRRSSAASTHDLRRLEEYDFYPFVVTAKGHVEFSPDAFNTAVDHFLEETNARAAGELIVIGEQNLVRDTFPSDRLRKYKRLYEVYEGDRVIDDNDVFLENYRRIVNQIGRSFPHTGIEILLHNLVNPSRSLVAIENGEVTGRSVGSGATNLVLDLKTRKQRGEEKVNYELNLGARRFKCTTIPIFRPNYGLIGAICINIDANFISEAVARDEERLQAFIDNFLRVDFQLEENILSPDEYSSALSGKRHFLDDAIRRPGSGTTGHRLAAILFSDIEGFTTLMGDDESSTLQIVRANEEIHRRALASHRGRLLKLLGDGVLASFDSASEAVAAGQEIQRAVRADGRFSVRVGIHVGEVVLSGSDIHGDGVNIASRIQSEVAAGEIGISRAVFENVRNKEGFSAEHVGLRNLKNVETPVDLYLVNA